MRLGNLQLALCAVISAAGPSLGFRQRAVSATSTTTSSAAPFVNATSLVVPANTTVTSYPDTSTVILTTTIKAVTRPPGTILSVMTMITVKTVTTYVPGPVLGYPATLTKTVVTTGTTEFRRTNSDGKKTTLFTHGTTTFPLTTTVEDPNPPSSTDDYPIPWPFTYGDTDSPDSTATDDSTTATATDITTTAPPSTAPVPTTTSSSSTKPKA